MISLSVVNNNYHKTFCVRVRENYTLEWSRLRRQLFLVKFESARVFLQRRFQLNRKSGDVDLDPYNIILLTKSTSSKPRRLFSPRRWWKAIIKAVCFFSRSVIWMFFHMLEAFSLSTVLSSLDSQTQSSPKHTIKKPGNLWNAAFFHWSSLNSAHDRGLCL